MTSWCLPRGVYKHREFRPRGSGPQCKLARACKQVQHHGFFHFKLNDAEHGLFDHVRSRAGFQPLGRFQFFCRGQIL